MLKANKQKKFIQLTLSIQRIAPNNTISVLTTKQVC